MHLRTLSFGFALLALSVAAAAQEAGSDARPAPQRIHVIGASVSGGFEDGPMFGAEEAGDSVTVHHVLKRWADGEVRVSAHSQLEMCTLFRDPVAIGKKMVERAQKKKADIVVAVDFPFWFAYGFVRGPEEQERRQLFEVGLKYLASFDVPVVVGDLPDMTGATTRLLNPRQIPSPEILAALNARLKQWAAERDNVTIVPLAQVVRQLKVDGVELPLADGALKTAPGALLQGDRLHANRLGVAFLVHRLQHPLAQLFPDGHPLRARQWPFDRFVEAADAEPALEELQEQVEQAKIGK